MTDNIYACSTKVWRKFSEKQKAVFNNFYEQIGFKENQSAWAHPDMPKITTEHHAVMRHNMACFAAWSVKD